MPIARQTGAHPRLHSGSRMQARVLQMMRPMPGKDIPLRLVWREPLGAFCGGMLFLFTCPLPGSGKPLLFMVWYPPYFIIVFVSLALYMAPFAAVVGLATGQTIWWLHLRTRKRVGAAARVAVGVAYATAATLTLALIIGIEGWSAVMCGLQVGMLAGMFSAGQDVTQPPSRM